MTDPGPLVDTRRSLHAIAELVIAGPQFRGHGTIRLRSTPGGFGGVVSPTRVDGAELVTPDGRFPLTGSCRELADRAGVTAGAPDSYPASGHDPDSPLTVDPDAAAVLAAWFSRGEAALRRLFPDVEPVLWPEHFDLGVSVAEVNYGVSPGDSGYPLPYAYVGPWEPREGPFWNAPFGAMAAADELPDVDAVAAFLAAGRAAAADA
ncbi:MAG: hypothetical protein OJJ54_19785 [Pseudonocardia sp.]|nr:hypothetical protein [Pseudonocardia sp.]